MKAKQIEKLLTGVMNNLIDSVTDEEIVDIFKNFSYIAGGCIPSMLLGEYVNDYDIYFHNKNYAKKVKEYYKSLKPSEEILKLKKVYQPKLITENSINLTDKIQLITKYTGLPHKVTKLFDWQHIKSYFSFKDGLVLTDDVYKLIIEKELIYTGSNFPLSSLLRSRKFIKRGWYISTKTMVHIVFDILSAFEPIQYSEYTIEEFNNRKESTKESHKIVNKQQKLKMPEKFDYEENNYKISIDKLIQQLNGVDPLTIQVELEKQLGKQLTLSEVLELL